MEIKTGAQKWTLQYPIVGKIRGEAGEREEVILGEKEAKIMFKFCVRKASLQGTLIHTSEPPCSNSYLKSLIHKNTSFPFSNNQNQATSSKNILFVVFTALLASCNLAPPKYEVSIPFHSRRRKSQEQKNRLHSPHVRPSTTLHPKNLRPPFCSRVRTNEERKNTNYRRRQSDEGYRN